MFKLTGAVVLVLAFAISAQAQSRGGGAHFTATTSGYSNSGGGAGGGGTGSSGSGTLQHIAPTQFAVRSVTGSSSDYIPSTFVSFSTAVAEGKAALAHLAALEAPAEENGTSAQTTAKIDVVQDQNGAPAIVEKR